MPIKTARELFLFDLAIARGAEQCILEGMQQMEQMAQNVRLRQMLQDHVDAMPRQMRLLEQCFDALGSRSRTIRSDAAEGLVHDFKKVANQVQDVAVIDLAILDVYDKIENYQVGAYKSLLVRSNVMGDDRLTQLLNTILSHEESEVRRTEDAEIDLARQALPELPPGQPYGYAQ